MNILLTCAGRRNYLVRYFQEALAGLGCVYAADNSDTAPALQEADHALILPPVAAPNYIDVLKEICRSYDIGLVFSLNDLELPLLARAKQSLLQSGTIAVVSDPHFVDLCFDKWATDRFLAELGIDRPKTYLTLQDAMQAVDRGELSLPVVVKPRWGTASLLIEYPQTALELDMTYRLNELRVKRSLLADTHAGFSDQSHLLVQEMLLGTEYGLDIVNDLQGRYITTFVKQKLAMRAGETDKARTVTNEGLLALGRTIGEASGHVGNLDCDVFVVGERLSVLEMNPRFGGGYPFSHAAGANLPAAFIAWAQGRSPRKEWLQVASQVASAKYDSLVEVSHLPRRLELSANIPRCCDRQALTDASP